MKVSYFDDKHKHEVERNAGDGFGKNLPHYNCRKCGASWVPRKEKPVRCPKCFTILWNREAKKSLGRPKKQREVE